MFKEYVGLDLQKMYPGPDATPDQELIDNWTWETFLTAAEKCAKGGHPFGLGLSTCTDSINVAGVVFAAHGASVRWPKEANDGIETYLGLPCFDTQGRVIGHLACRDRKPMPGELPQGAVIKLFAVRASVEMERRVLERMQAVDPRLPTHTTPD
jgi:hypothetical protein